MFTYGLGSKTDLETVFIVGVGFMRCCGYNQKGVLFKRKHTGKSLTGKTKV